MSEENRYGRFFLRIASTPIQEMTIRPAVKHSAIVPRIAITKDYFSICGTTVAQGRTFARGEIKAGSYHVVILGRALWENRSGADPDIVGSETAFFSEPDTVIGILGSDDSRIHRLAAIRGDTHESFVYSRGDLSAALGELDRLADGAAFLVGLNIIAFDLPDLGYGHVCRHGIR